MDNKDLLYSTWDSAQCYAAAWMGAEFGGECIFSCSITFWLFAAPWTVCRLQAPHGIFPGKNTGTGCHFLLQEIFLTRGSNPCLLCLLHWQADSLPLTPPGKPLGENGYMCMKVPSLLTWNYHNTVNQLYSNIKFFFNFLKKNLTLPKQHRWLPRLNPH